MPEQLWTQLIVTVGPFGAVVVYLLWRCIQRQNVREDRLAEVIANNAAVIEQLSGSSNRGYDQAVENSRVLQKQYSLLQTLAAAGPGSCAPAPGVNPPARRHDDAE